MTFSPLLPVGMLVVVLGAMALFAIVQFARAPRRPGAWHWLIRLGMVVLLFGLALRPGLPTNLRPPTASGDVDVYFVVDTTALSWLLVTVEVVAPEHALKLSVYPFCWATR